MDQQTRDEWTRTLIDLIETRAATARDAASVDDHLAVLRLHRKIEDELDKFFGPQVRDAMRAGASWQQVVAATDWDETSELYMDWGHAQFATRSPEEFAEVMGHLQQLREERRQAAPLRAG